MPANAASVAALDAVADLMEVGGSYGAILPAGLSLSRSCT